MSEHTDYSHYVHTTYEVPLPRVEVSGSIRFQQCNYLLTVAESMHVIRVTCMEEYLALSQA